MHYVDPPQDLPQRTQAKRLNFWPLIVPLICAGVWLIPIAIFCGADVALFCAIVAGLGIGAVGFLALLPLAEGLDTLGIGH